MKITRLLAVGSLLAAYVGCYHYRVEAPNTSASNDARSEVRWSLIWGLVQQDPIDTTCICKNAGIKEVTATSNFGFDLLTVLTLGLVAPSELEYVCAKPPVGAPWPNPPTPEQCPDVDFLDAPPPRTPDAGIPEAGIPSSDAGIPSHDPFIENDPDAGAF